jgi:hypothetical protein
MFPADKIPAPPTCHQETGVGVGVGLAVGVVGGVGEGIPGPTVGVGIKVGVGRVVGKTYKKLTVHEPGIGLGNVE